MLQVIQQPNQPEGLQMLGNILMQEGHDYSARQHMLEDEARRRGYQLQDIATQHTWKEKDYDREQQAILDRERTLQGIRTEDDAKRILVSEGLLGPADINDPVKVQAAQLIAHQQGIDKIYNDILTTPDENGKPLLDRNDLGNPQAIEAAKAKLDAVAARRNAFAASQPMNAQAEQARLNSIISGVLAQSNALNAKLNSPTPQPNGNQIRARAEQIATQIKGGKTASVDEINAAIPQATQEIQTAIFSQWQMERQDALVQKSLLDSQLKDLRSQVDVITQKSGVYPTPAQAPVASPPQALGNPQQPSVVTPEQAAAALRATLSGANREPRSAPSAFNALQDPTGNNPIIAAANAHGAAAVQQSLADPYNQSLDALDASKARVAQITAGTNPDFVVGGIATKTGETGSLTPDMQAKMISDELIRQAQLVQQANMAKRTFLGLSPTAMLANPVSLQPGVNAAPVGPNLASVHSFDFGNGGD